MFAFKTLTEESSSGGLHLMSLEGPLIVPIKGALLDPLQPQGKPGTQLSQFNLLCVLELIPVMKKTKQTLANTTQQTIKELIWVWASL
ncbi:hypothetical protein E2C01_030012 [Portunus trituberculatus]|uniref:Uncharacterized protein n=1 Tax=Portunus trituberculatus TaxID=210409 RepID=A0A5B7EPC9_PORTR|nr:hypothetical protein [Portunus trituberculatus]